MFLFLIASFGSSVLKLGSKPHQKKKRRTNQENCFYIFSPVAFIHLDEFSPQDSQNMLEFLAYQEGIFVFILHVCHRIAIRAVLVGSIHELQSLCFNGNLAIPD